MSAACVNCTARQVSSTSLEVMPWCMKRASSPTFSATQVRKAMTSCLVTASIASIAATSIAGFVAHQSHSALAADLGTEPSSASASVARSEERRVGNEGVVTGRSRWSTYPSKKQPTARSTYTRSLVFQITTQQDTQNNTQTTH